MNGALEVTLHPGDVTCVDAGTELDTLLGSCVAIVLTDPRRTVAAMCHVVHAGRAPAGAPRRAMYGDDALDEMSARLRARAIEPRLCQAWLYGGGNMFPRRVGPHASDGNIGAANVSWALGALASAGIELNRWDLGGNSYRRLTWTVGPDNPRLRVEPVDATGVAA